MTSERGRTALDIAVGGHGAVFRLLLAAGADPEQRIGEIGQEASLRFAAARGMTAQRSQWGWVSPA
ncbi:ankyrin repeat domain-containing protein [Streptomyces sp. NPDC051572]|uniref:ankyrin repeat domain-containing protein n=1 Tax=Streptomyces sp. NPDC051572 TaxID=3155802 RepID=UPI00344CB107